MALPGGAGLPAGALPAGVAGYLAGTSSPGAGGGGSALARLPAPAGEEGDEGDLVEMANVEGQIRGSSLRRLSSLVETHPEQSLTIVRAWMNEGSNS
jgi:flagellar M-ring protein FliF